MIINNIPKLHPVKPFLEGLDRAARGVVRVRVAAASKTEGFFTGWMVTHDLVISVPNNVSNAPVLQFFACTSDDPEEVEMHRILGGNVPRNAEDDLSISIFRLARQLPGRATRLGTRDATVGEAAIVLQYGGGAPHLSFSMGKITAMDGPLQHYDASTEAGSTGGPIIELGSWEIAGMHRKARPDLQLNQGLTLTTILNLLRESPVWGEIADFQELANVSATVAPPQPAIEAPALEAVSPPPVSLLPAALLWSFDPEVLPGRDVLRPLVINARAPRWTLKPAERRRLIEEAGTLSALQAARRSAEDTTSSAPSGREQQVIDRILHGPPFDLDAQPEEALPYWLQIVRWFAGVVPDLPAPADVISTLERKRMHSRLVKMTGNDFQGREDELKKMSLWQQKDDAGAMVITGIGGVGKSALVAQFALQQPDDTIILWLDFDRPDLAPDDAVSVLRLISEQLVQQMAQAPQPEISPTTWEAAAGDLAEALASHPSVLIILDGFEVAQYVRKHQEIWSVLERFTSVVPSLRIIISGRAPVKGLHALGRKTDALHLTGLPDKETAAWLREHGITDDSVVAKTVKLCKGIPLMLKTVFHLMARDGIGALTEVLESKDDELVQGFLYDRILDRVIDPLLKPVAQDALILRRITETMLTDLLSDRIPEGLTAAEVISRLQQELALVGDHGEGAQLAMADEPGTLRLRPEVRSATIHLLEAAQPARVRDIDSRAATWYAKQDLQRPANAAELVYHRLRLGDVQSAELAWSPAVIPFLQHDEPDLPEKEHHARSWLRQKLVVLDGSTEALTLWEQEAQDRIQQSLLRGLTRVVPEILKEKPGRSPDSPLIFFDAWIRWREKDYDGALHELQRPLSSNPVIQRNRSVLGALIHRDSGNIPAARQVLTRLLPPVDPHADSPDTLPGSATLEALAIQAALIRLLVDLEAEAALARRLNDHEKSDTPQALRYALSGADAVLPTLSAQLPPSLSNFEAISALEIPRHPSELPDFLASVRRHREHTLGYFQITDDLGPEEASGQEGTIAGDNNLPEADPDDLGGSVKWKHKDASQVARHIAVLATRRWHIVGTSLFLHQSCSLALGSSGPAPLTLAVAATLLPFRGMFLSYGGHDLDFLLDSVLRQMSDPSLRKTASFNTRSLKSLLDNRRLLGESLLKDTFRIVSGILRSNSTSLQALQEIRDPETRFFLLYMLAPDPLETLCAHIANPVQPTTVSIHLQME